jgi:hypothetical protein
MSVGHRYTCGKKMICHSIKVRNTAEVCLLIGVILGCEQTKTTVALPQEYHEQGRSISPEGSTSTTAQAVRLYWQKNRESDLVGYRIFRRCRPYEPDSDLPWTNWGLLVEKYSPVDTTHLDKTVKNQYEYEYKITAYDSLGLESKFSNTRRRRVYPQKED